MTGLGNKNIFIVRYFIMKGTHMSKTGRYKGSLIIWRSLALNYYNDKRAEIIRAK